MAGLMKLSLHSCSVARSRLGGKMPSGRIVGQPEVTGRNRWQAGQLRTPPDSLESGRAAGLEVPATLVHAAATKAFFAFAAASGRENWGIIPRIILKSLLASGFGSLATSCMVPLAVIEDCPSGPSKPVAELHSEFAVLEQLDTDLPSHEVFPRTHEVRYGVAR